VKFYKFIFVLLLVTFSSHAYSENVLINKNWLTQCEQDVFEGTSKCLVINHEGSLNSERTLVIERVEDNELALVVLIKEKVETDFHRAIELSIKIGQNPVFSQRGSVSFRNENYLQAVIVFDDASKVINQMKKGSFINVKVAIPSSDFELLDKFSLSGFTKTYNKALALDKRRPEAEAEEEMDAETREYYEARARQVNDQVEDSLEGQLKSAMTFDSNTSERVGDSGDAIQAYIKRGLLGKKPKERSDYTDYWVIKKPIDFMGHKLVIIEEEYMTKFIGCCVSPGLGITVKVNSDVAELKDFARANKCSVTTKNKKEINEEMSFLGVVAKDEGEYVTLSCRERDANS
jgi:hypothetical protein